VAGVNPAAVTYDYRVASQPSMLLGRWAGTWYELLALSSMPATQYAVVFNTSTLDPGYYDIEFRSRIQMPGVDKTQFSLPSGAVWDGDWIDNGWRQACRMTVLRNTRKLFTVTFSRFPSIKKYVDFLSDKLSYFGQTVEVKDKGAIVVWIENKPLADSGYMKTTIGAGGSLEIEVKQRGPIDLRAFGIPTAYVFNGIPGLTGFVGVYEEVKIAPFLTFTDFQMDFHTYDPRLSSLLRGSLTGGLKGSAEFGVGAFVKAKPSGLSVEVKGGASMGLSGAAGVVLSESAIRSGKVAWWRCTLGQVLLVAEAKVKYEGPGAPTGGIELKYTWNTQLFEGFRVPANEDDTWFDLPQGLKEIANRGASGSDPIAESARTVNYHLAP